MDKVLNLNLLKNPLNWLILYLMVLVGSLAIRYIIPAAPSSSDA